MDWASLQLLIGALIGAVASAVVTLTIAHQTRGAERRAREEARKSVRAELRRTAYGEFAAQIQGHCDKTAAWHAETGQDLTRGALMAAYHRDLGASSHKFDRCEIAAKLAAGPVVLQVLDEFIDWYRNAIGQTLFGQAPGLQGIDEKLTPLVAAMRSELNDDMSIPVPKANRARA